VTGQERPCRHPRLKRREDSPWKRVNLWKGLGYWYDAEAVREASTGNSKCPKRPSSGEKTVANEAEPGVKPSRFDAAVPYRPETRNLRSVWEIPTAPFPDAHFATFPPKLVEPCIRAGCAGQVCAECGAPWVRVVEREKRPRGDCLGRKDVGGFDHGQAGSAYMETVSVQTLGFRATCSCDASTVPGLVLDPFAGSGTTGLVALAEGCRFLGFELSPEYATMARRRCAKAEREYQPALFADVTP